MNEGSEHLSRLLDGMAAERAMAVDSDLEAETLRLAQTAAFLKGANLERALPDEDFVAALGARLAAAQDAVQEPAAAASPMSAHAASVPQPGSSQGLSRRGLIGKIAAAAAGIAAGSGAGEAIRGQADQAAASAAYERGKHAGYHQMIVQPYSTEMVPEDRGSWFETGHNVHTLPAGRPVPFRTGAIAGYVIDPGGGKPPYALAGACTHMGCQVGWRPESGTFLCPCHGARYRTDGSVETGIARHPLPPLRLKVDEKGDIYIWSVEEHPRITAPARYELP